MLNFTVGPVHLHEDTRRVGGEDIPYFRTKEFSSVVFRCEELLKEFTFAPKNSRVLLLTGSGTFSMEASVSNIFDKKDKVLVINGGTFGARFSEICTIYGIPHEDLKLESGKSVKKEDLIPFEGKGFTGLLVNADETSTGVLYDLKLLGDFCKRNNLIFIVDAISAFLSDEINMNDIGADAVLIGSQKALSLAPGLSICVLSERAVQRINAHPTFSLYLDLKSALKDAERGQTPFTPAVGTILQLKSRLESIKDQGLSTEQAKIKDLAEDFRNKIKDLPLTLYSDSLPNAVTALKVKNCSAQKVFEILKDEYGIFVCPNGGDLKDMVFRVGHIGNLSKKDNDKLISALNDLVKRNILK